MRDYHINAQKDSYPISMMTSTMVFTRELRVQIGSNLIFSFNSSEYRQNFATAPKGERVTPNWISNFEKVTIGGSNGGNRA
jgi:hypothetical protein